MATELQFRRGTTNELNTITGVIGEIFVNTDDYSIRVHDGTTQGGASILATQDYVSNLTTDDLTEGSTNKYFATSLVDSHLSGGTGVSYNAGEISIGQAVGTTDSVTFNNVTVNGTLNSDDITAATMTASGNVVVQGNLTVNGTTTTINSTTVAIDDLNIALASEATNATEANGAGITVTGANATLTYASITDTFDFNKELRVSTNEVWHAGNDGAGSGLDADLLDGQQGSYYYPASNPSGYTTNTGTVTSVATGTGLTGGTITGSGTISHADTSSQTSVNNSGSTFIQDITLDGFGHITAIGSAAVSIPTVNNATINLTAGTGLTGGQSFTTNQSFSETISFSVATNGISASQLNVSGNGNVGQALLSDGDGSFSWGDAGGGGATVDFGYNYNSLNDGQIFINRDYATEKVVTDSNIGISVSGFGTSYSFAIPLTAAWAFDSQFGNYPFTSSVGTGKFDGTLAYDTSANQLKVFNYNEYFSNGGGDGNGWFDVGGGGGGGTTSTAIGNLMDLRDSSFNSFSFYVHNVSHIQNANPYNYIVFTGNMAVTPAFSPSGNLPASPPSSVFDRIDWGNGTWMDTSITGISSLSSQNSIFEIGVGYNQPSNTNSFSAGDYISLYIKYDPGQTQFDTWFSDWENSGVI